MDNLRELPVLLFTPGLTTIPGDEILNSLVAYETKHEKTVSLVILVPVDYELYCEKGIYPLWKNRILRPLLGISEGDWLIDGQEKAYLGEFFDLGDYYHVYLKT